MKNQDQGEAGQDHRAVRRVETKPTSESDASQSSESQGVTDKWYVHIVGPDDVIEKSSEIDALRSANAVNVTIERERRGHANDPNWPFAMALAVRSQEETDAS